VRSGKPRRSICEWKTVARSAGKNEFTEES
jgi:hypothetical protein